ncbi:MAG: tRNA uridine-5-carboxymethylaminomethyl(34) synthesis GTPase MnmE [Verrucomicrobiota bacterium]|nr:tRNA uridine-5-carboxymethylaminomethyl(34) synthesis GTPase MnmE [Verrucomicrobiota bacterium]
MTVDDARTSARYGQLPETIAAISTAAGEGAIAVVRMSGADAIAVADAIFRGTEKPSVFPSQTQRLGEVVDGARFVDQVMLAVHRAPASYTGEDVVEISCHGGTLVTARVLDACLRAGARAARPGEFTERAYLNGKMDLTQAEAVIDVIRARTDLALRAAHEQLEGRLGSEVRRLREELIALIAQVEASIDFPDEGISPDEDATLQQRLDAIRGRTAELLATAEHGRILREGVRVVIYGATNAGKSSLLNRLLKFERAIVSEIPGTTRDTIEEVINVRGVPVRLLDTAGVRDSSEPLERAGIERTKGALANADIVFHVADRHEPKPADFDEMPPESPRLVLLNKADLPEHPDWNVCADALRISCLQPDGLRGLEDRLLGLIGEKQVRPESGVAINLRHAECLRRAAEALDRARETMERRVGAEYAAVDLQSALRAVSEVLGSNDDEAILDSVFAQFCIGK